MGIQINGNNDTISALDGSWTAEGATTFTGAAGFNGKVSIGGTLTYEDVTNIDAVGIVTARTNVYVGADVAHLGDLDTKITFTDNQIDLRTGGSSRIYASNTALFVGSGFPLGFLASSGPSPSIKSGGTNNQDLLLTTGNSNPTRIHIKTDGKIGINESANINGRLHVQHDALAENILYATRYNDQGNDKPILAITEATMTGWSASGLVIGNHNRDIHIGSVFDSSAAVTTGSVTGIRISSGGNVGIGSAIPSEKLDVNGSIR